MLFPKLLRRRHKPSGPTIHGVPVTMQELRSYIFERDQICVAWRADPAHECRDRWGYPHAPTETYLLTLAHVPAANENALGKKAPDDERHAVAECYNANAGVTRELRAYERAYLARVEPG